MPRPHATPTLEQAGIRRWLLAILSFGLMGAGIELILIEHYQSGIELVPLAAVALALIVVVWHGLTRHRLSIRVLQATMVLFLIVGLAGVGLHFRGAAEFQLEIDPGAGGWEIFKKAIRAKAPPVLAPGIMVQLALVGLAYVYRHPTLNAGEVSQLER
jgi:multisubunit Na+/H+ antiporter MnhB subunit